MNTMLHPIRDVALLGDLVSDYCEQVFAASEEVLAFFRFLFPTARTEHEDLLLADWARLASVPAAQLQNTTFIREMTEEDARRVLLTTHAVRAWLHAVQLGQTPPPRWAQGHPSFA